MCVHRLVGGIDKRRMAVDFQELNARTVCDAYPMPDCDAILGRLSAAKYYMALNVKSGFW